MSAKFILEATCSLLIYIAVIGIAEFKFFRSKAFSSAKNNFPGTQVLLVLIGGVASLFLCLYAMHLLNGLTPNGFSFFGWILCTAGGLLFVMSQYWAVRKLFYHSIRDRSPQKAVANVPTQTDD